MHLEHNSLRVIAISGAIALLICLATVTGIYLIGSRQNSTASGQNHSAGNGLLTATAGFSELIDVLTQTPLDNTTDITYSLPTQPPAISREQESRQRKTMVRQEVPLVYTSTLRVDVPYSWLGL